MNFEPLLKVAPFSGTRVKPFDGIRSYLSTGDLQDESIAFVTVTYKDKPSRADITVKKGDVLFARMKGTKKVLEVTQALDGVIVSTGFAVLRPEKECDANYLAIYLRSDLFDKQKEKYCSGAIQPAITNGGIEKIHIPFPPLDDQFRIANLLSKVEGLIAQRKQHLKHLDDLLKSVFLDMFGENMKQGSHEPLGNHIDVLTDYHANGSYEVLRKHVELTSTPNYALMVRTTDLENKNFEKGCNYITKEAYEFLAKSKVFGGEIIINKIGSAGKIYLMPKLNRPVSLGMNAFLVRLGPELNYIFTYYFLTSNYGASLIQKRVKGAVTKTITKEAIRSISLPVPDIGIQNRFAGIVEDIKTRYQKSLAELENLYGALSQKAFKGELDLSRVPLPAPHVEGEQAVTIAPLLTQAAAPVINLPDSDLLLQALENRESLKGLLQQWLEAYRTQLGDSAFSAERFMAAAQTQLDELHPDNDFELGSDDYDHIKKWVFAALADGKLKQAYVDADNRIQLKAE
jgi:type I restriction enzyme S subunit